MSTFRLSPSEWPPMPEIHAAFLRGALSKLETDSRVVGVVAGGSALTAELDEYSDLDLVIAVEPAFFEEALRGRRATAEALGPLLAGFTGEHVGESRLLICLYGPPLLHVDLKWVPLPDLGERVEEPLVLLDRDGRVREVLRASSARCPRPDPQWIEDRFWVWVHYLAGKIGRGEIFETLDGLGFLRARVLGPLALEKAGHRPQGVRRFEARVPDRSGELAGTVSGHDRLDCVHAVLAAVQMYRSLRGPEVRTQPGVEREAITYLEEIRTAVQSERHGTPDR